MRGGGWSIEAVENRVPIYQGVHEDELDSGRCGSFAIKKISNITGKTGAAVPNYRDGDGVIYFTRELHRAPFARRDDPSQLGSRKCDFNNVAN